MSLPTVSQTFVDNQMATMRGRTTREWLAMPEWVKAELLDYVEFGRIEDGTTLTWALQNNWKMTVSYAGDDIWPIMRELMIVIVNYIPSWSQGSPEAYDEWIKMGGLRGAQEKPDAEA